MNLKYILITIAIFFINNILIWYQLNGQLVWSWWKTTQGILTTMLLAIPITIAFWWATNLGYQGFGNLWPVRLMGFATSMMTFPIMTYFYLGETMSLATIISILLAFIIMLIQLI